MGIMESALVRRVRQSPRLRPPAVAAYRAMDRMRPAPPGPRVLANSMPKSGTHLIATLLDQLEGMRFAGHLVAFDVGDAHAPEKSLAHLDKRLRALRDSHYIGAHLIRDPRVEERIAAAPVKLLTILRDPRAVVLSGAHYVMDAKQLKDRDEALEIYPDLDSVLRALVHGHGEPGDRFYFPEIGQRYAAYAAWADSEVGHLVRFEDLIGGRGGGSDDAQVAQVAAIVDHLGYHEGVATPTEIAERLFSDKVITFRTGAIDSWRREMPADLVREIEDRCAATMDRLGYTS